ncbi:MAG: hypothetical protein Q4D74_04260, partial [Comamonadaceae bacterium]|nr:hypothetical protein [Comamonadaceae bacterium]
KSNGAALALLPDGRILASGDRAAIYANPAHSPGICLEGVRSDGQRDPSFANGQPLWLHAGANTVLKSLDVNPLGHITLTARTRDAAGTCAFNASRITATGQLDSRFGRGGTARLPLAHTESAACVLDASLHTAQGHTVMVGRRWGPAMQETVWTRLTPDGRPDAAFSPAGIHAMPGPSTAYLLQDAKGRWLRIDITTDSASGNPMRARITRLMGEAG